MNFFEMLTISFAIQGALVALMLFYKKSHQKHSNVLWGVFLLLFSYNLTYNAYYWAFPKSYVTRILNFVFFLPFSLYGPLFYLYIRSLVESKKLGIKDFYHFIPFILVLVNFFKFFLLPLPERAGLEEGSELYNYIYVSPYALFVIMCIILLSYSVVTYLELRPLYDGDREMKIWLKTITVCFLLFSLTWPIYLALYMTGVLTEGADYAISFSMVFFIGLTTYFGFFHSDIFNGKPLTKVFPFIKYKNSGISKEVLAEFKTKLDNEMESNSLYLDSELRLDDLAKRLNVSRHHVSQVINESFGMNFYDYVNTYRINEAKKMLEDIDSNHMNITDIAFKSGFNNRMSFYNTFRKHFGTTPTQFRNQSMAS